MSDSAVQSPLPADYRQACERIAKLMRKQKGVKAIAVRYHGDYADIWVIGESARRFDLIRPLGAAIRSVQAAYPQVRLDSHVTDGPAPDDFLIWAGERPD